MTLRNTYRLHRGLIAGAIVLFFKLATIGSLIALLIAAFAFEAAPIRELGIATFACLVLLAVSGIHFRRTLTALVAKDQGQRAFNEGRYQDAEARLRFALEQAFGYGDDDPWRGDMLSLLALTLRAQGKYDDAERIGKEAIGIYETALGKDDARTVSALETLARIYLDIARYAQARALLERALQVRERATAETMVPCLLELARSWSELGDWSKAAPYLMRAHEIVERSPSPTFERWLVLLNLARLRIEDGKLDDAETLIEAAWREINERAPPEPYFVAMVLHHRAILREKQQRYEEAEDQSRRALTLMEQVVPENHFSLAPTLDVIARSLASQGKWQEAETVSLRALGLQREFLAPEHPFLAESLEICADAARHLGKGSEAAQLAHEAHEIRDFHAAQVSG